MNECKQQKQHTTNFRNMFGSAFYADTLCTHDDHARNYQRTGSTIPKYSIFSFTGILSDEKMTWKIFSKC